jgi:hypothetical protein
MSQTELPVPLPRPLPAKLNPTNKEITIRITAQLIIKVFFIIPPFLQDSFVVTSAHFPAPCFLPDL